MGLEALRLQAGSEARQGPGLERLQGQLHGRRPPGRPESLPRLQPHEKQNHADSSWAEKGVAAQASEKIVRLRNSSKRVSEWLSRRQKQPQVPTARHTPGCVKGAGPGT